MKHGPHKQLRQFVGKRLLEIRTARGLSQDKLADKAGIHRAYIGVIEKARKGVGIDLLGRVFDALDVTPQEFFSDKKFKARSDDQGHDH